MKNLIVYFSWSNNTKNLVEEINSKLGLDVKRVERKIPYSTDYNTCAYIEAKQEWEKSEFPEICDLKINYNNYDNILLFFPIWWYTFPRPIATFIKSLNGYSKNVYVFANCYTNDRNYMVNSMRDLKKLDANINFHEGLFNRPADEHIKFIEKI